MAVIKASEVLVSAVVRPLSRPQPKTAPVISSFEAERQSLLGEIAALVDQIHQHDQSISDLRVRHEAEVLEAELAARQAGFQEGSGATSELLATLADAIVAGTERLDAQMPSLERLAVLIAQIALEKMLGDLPDNSELVTRLIARQVRELEASAVLRIDVASHDFPDPEALERLGEASGQPAIEVQARDDLASGDCHLQLTLGGLEIGLDQQWSKLKAALTQMAQPQGAV